MEMIKVYNAENEFEANMLIVALEEEGIASYQRESGVGEWMTITQGFSVYGNDIYVAEDDEQRANEIIKTALEASKSNLGEEDNSYEEISKKKHKLIWGMLIFMVALIVGLFVGFSL